jgi:hypothetical protein
MASIIRLSGLHFWLSVGSNLGGFSNVFPEELCASIAVAATPVSIQAVFSLGLDDPYVLFCERHNNLLYVPSKRHTAAN